MNLVRVALDVPLATLFDYTVLELLTPICSARACSCPSVAASAPV